MDSRSGPLVGPSRGAPGASAGRLRPWRSRCTWSRSRSPPLSIGQAVLAGGLVFLAVLAERFFGSELGRRQWIGIALVAVSLSLLTLTGGGGGGGAHSGDLALILVGAALIPAPVRAGEALHDDAVRADIRTSPTRVPLASHDDRLVSRCRPLAVDLTRRVRYAHLPRQDQPPRPRRFACAHPLPTSVQPVTTDQPSPSCGV